MRHAVLLLLLCGCSSLTSSQQQQLALHQRNAKIYWQGGNLDQALGQVERGLELDPNDYTLRTMQGAILLKQSPDSQTNDFRLLDRATAILADVFETRAENRHEPALLFNYALALQKQGRRHANEATRIEALAARTGSTDDTAKVQAERDRAKSEFDRGHALLHGLVDRGELLRLSHYHLLLGAHDTGDADAVTKHSTAYLELAAREQALAEAEIKRTNEPGYERDQKIQLARLRREELEVRALLAEYHYGRQEYALALAMLDRTLEIAPERSVDYYNRGRVLLQLDRDQDAKADFRKFLATTDLPASSEKAIFAAATISK